VKAKFSQYICTIPWRAGADVNIHVNFNLRLDGGGRSGTLFGRFNNRQSVSRIHTTGDWVGPDPVWTEWRKSQVWSFSPKQLLCCLSGSHPSGRQPWKNWWMQSSVKHCPLAINMSLSCVFYKKINVSLHEPESKIQISFYTFLAKELGYLSQYSVWLRTWRQEFDHRQGKVITRL
jgi:hypothetical protein